MGGYLPTEGYEKTYLHPLVTDPGARDRWPQNPKGKASHSASRSPTTPGLGRRVHITLKWPRITPVHAYEGTRAMGTVRESRQGRGR